MRPTSNALLPPWTPAAAISLLFGCGRDGAAPSAASDGLPRRPDVVLVSIDSLRPDHLGCYGYRQPTSPTIDRLAEEGVRCEVALSTTSWTLPAHAAMLTGLFDSAHGVVDNGLALPQSRTTLAEALQHAGWRTAAFYGAPYLDPVFGLDQGFETYASCMSPAAEDSHRDVTGPRTVAAVERWLAESLAEPSPRPFFLFVHLWDVHYDYRPPEGYAEKFDPGYEGALDASDLPRNPAVAADMAPRDFQHLLALYDGEIRFTDENLGAILAAIDRHDRLRDALVVVTADHGEEFFEHGGKGHQKTLFEEVVRVPLIVRWPGHLPRAVVRDPVRLVDLAPTILALAGVADRPSMQGRDVSPLLRGEPLPAAPALLELLVDGDDVRGLRTQDSKVISWRHAGKTYLYDLLRDPREEAPIAEPSPRLQPALAALDAALHATAGFAGAAPASTEISADLARRLGVLGYAGDAAPKAPAGQVIRTHLSWRASCAKERSAAGWSSSARASRASRRPSTSRAAEPTSWCSRRATARAAWSARSSATGSASRPGRARCPRPRGRSGACAATSRSPIG
jgi:arylsulfatase A-like enzyme